MQPPVTATTAAGWSSRYRHRPADGRARRDDREHRPAVRPARPRLLGRRPPVGDHRLRAGVRQPAAARRADRRPVRPQVDVHRRPARLRRGVGGRRRRASFGVLVGARALQGAFAALLAPAALSLLTTTFTDPTERGKAFSVYAAIAGMGGAIGLLLGGALTELLDWRWCLYVSVVFAVPAAIAAARLLHHVPARTAAARCPRRADRVARPVRAGVRPVAGRDRRWGDPVTLGLLGRVRPRHRLRRAQTAPPSRSCRCASSPIVTGGAFLAIGQ